MAAKVNTRLLLIVVLVFGAALALLGGVYVLKLRGDATRSYRKGEAAFNKGDYKTAYDQFGRALGKDPGNLQYLQRVEESLLKIVPQSTNEATEDYSRYLATLGHAAVHNPTDPNAHLRLIKELHSTARRTNAQPHWDMLVAAADNMNQRVADGDPQKPLAKVYRALATARLAATKSDEEIQLAIQDLDEAAAKLVNNDLAWAAEIALRGSWLTKMGVSGKSQTSIDAQRELFDATQKRAIEAAPMGPETAAAYLTSLVLNKMNKSGVVTDDEIQTAGEHLASTIKPDAETGLVVDAVGLLGMTPGTGPELALRVLRDAISANPQAYELHLLQARLMLDQGDEDRAESVIRSVLSAPQLPVSFVSQMQFSLRPQAASLLCDIEFRRYSKASASDRPAALQKMKAARDQLASLSIDPANDPLLTRTDAKMAFAQQQFVDAAAKFEQLVRLTDNNDLEMLAYSAASLEQIGQIGLAYERITTAVQSKPDYIPWIIAKAQMELRMGNSLEAARTIDVIPNTALSDPQVQQIVSVVRRAASAPSSAPASTDPVQVAILAAQDALDKNEVENARAALLAALHDHADSLPLYRALAQVEIRAGNREAAGKYVEQGLKLSASDQLLNQLSVGLRFDDPVQATTEYLKATLVDEKQRLTALVVSMANLAQQKSELATRLTATSDDAGAKAASDVAARALAEANTAAEALAKVEPENAQLVEFRFSQALAAKDWVKASEQVAIAKRANIDVAGGVLFEGRLQMAQGNLKEAVLSLESATDKLGFSSYAWRTLAIAYQNSGNFAQAERAYEQAYRCNPNDVNGARAYLTLLMRRGDKTRALQILRSVHRLSPDDVGLRESWLDLEAEVGEAAVAVGMRSEIYANSPADRSNAVALARLLATLEPTRETILEPSGAPTYSQQRWASMSGVEQEDIRKDMRARWTATADKIIETLSQENADDLRVAVLKATVLRERGDISGGESVIRDFIGRHEKSRQTEDMYIELGRYQAAVSHFNDAVASLREAIALNGPQQRAAEMNLGTLQMQLRQYDQAIEALESARAKQDDPTLRLQIVECLINLGRLEDAEKGLNEVTSGSGGSVAILLQAQIYKTRGDKQVSQGDLAGGDRYFAQQRELLAKAEEQDPTNPTPRILLAQSLIDEYNRTNNRSLLDDAMVALERADRIRAGSVEVSALRVAILKEMGDRTNAIAELRKSLEVAPNNTAARRDLIQLLLESGDQRGAMAAVENAIRQNPTLAVWHETRGDLLRLSRGSAADIIAAYNSAFELSPSTTMLLKLADAMLSASPPNCRGIIEKLEARPEDLKADPSARETYARALACDGKRDQAVEQLRLAYARRTEMIKSGSMPAEDIARWYVALSIVFPGEQVGEAEKLANELTNAQPNVYDVGATAAMWMRVGPSGLSRALELQRQALILCPTNNTELRASLNSDLGDMLILGGNLKDAADAYDVAVRLRPSDINALNNLAFLRAENGNDPAAAVPLAERLLEAAPDKPEVLDTVGWVYFKNGDLEKAKQYLSQSAAIRPAADTYVHLATVLAKSGDASGVQQALVEAEKLSPSPETQQKIKALRDDMK